MPREVRTNVDTRQVLTPISRPKATEVVARVNDQLEVPTIDPELRGLVEGLSALSPSLQQYAYASRYSQQKENAGHTAAGAADAAQGKELKPGSHEYFQHGYMVQNGQVAAHQAGNAFANAVDTEFDKDTGDLQQFTKQYFAKDTKGISDGSYMEGYNQVIPKYIEDVQQGVSKYRGEALVQKTESNAMFKLDNSLRAYADNGEAIPDVVIDTQRNDLKGLGITGSRFNDLLFASMKRMGDEGNFSIYENLKRARPDGTPGMYNIPEWKQKIDAAQIHSQNVFLDNRRKSDEGKRKERADTQDKALNGAALKMLNGDTIGGRQDFLNLAKSGLFTDASEVFSWDSKFTAAEKREGSASQQAAESQLMVGIQKGAVRPQHIVAALSRGDISTSQARSLQNDWKAFADVGREARDQKAADSIFKTSHFDSGKDYLKTVLRPQASPLDPMGIGTEFARVQMATAEREYIEAARKVKDPQELYGISQEIANRYLTRNKDPRINKELTNAGNLRYTTLQELQDARKAGAISDLLEYQNQLRYFKATQGQNL